MGLGNFRETRDSIHEATVNKATQMNQQVLTPTAFVTSRSFEFLVEKELANQVGHKKDKWLTVVVRELVDNALDACEEAAVAPEIRVTVTRDSITVSDNGPGMPSETIARIPDFDVRISSREAYVGPSRGAQGLGMKDVLAIPYVLSGTLGTVVITAHGQRHQIELRANQIHQQPEPKILTNPVDDATNGTIVKVEWPNSACSLLEAASGEILQLAEDYSLLNPHLTLTVNVLGEERCFDATDANWKKWRPASPSSILWYDESSFERLVAAHISHDQAQGTDLSVREFVSIFRGLRGTSKQKTILQATGLARQSLSALADGGDLRHDLIGPLLEAMQANSRPVSPASLGVIGKQHISAQFEPHCHMGSFRYKKSTDLNDEGIPAVVETAFAVLKDGQRGRRMTLGVNWSPGIGNPFRQLGGQGESLDAMIEQQRVGHDRPVMLLVHLACPRIQYTDRGKTGITVD